MTGSLFQLCAMDEAIGYSRRITRGIEVNEDTLAVDVINNVGPNSHYLRQPHTRHYYKSEYFYPKLLDRQNFENWESTGSLTMQDRTIARVHDIWRPTSRRRSSRRPGRSSRRSWARPRTGSRTRSSGEI